MPLASPSPSAKATATATPAPTSKATAVPAILPVATPTPDFELTIVKSGTGLGAIYAWPSGRSQQLCGSSDKQCAYTYPFNTSFSFQVIPRPDSQFEGWTGDCQGQVCELTLDRAKKLTASFGLAEIKKPVPETVPITPPKNDGPAPTPPYIPRPTPTLKPPAEGNYPLIVQVTGKGTVKSPDGRVQCSEYCENKYARFSEIPLSAKPAEGWKFVGWGGSCLNAEGPECTVTVEGSALFVSSTTVRAVFEPETRVLSVGIEGDGWVHSGDTRIFCGTSGRIVYICAGYYPFESRFELTARASGGSTFERWEGACTHSQPKCAVSMNSDKSARAVFKGPPSNKKLTLEMPKEKGGAIYVMTAGPDIRIPLKECESNCTYEFKHGGKIEIEVKTYQGFEMEGYLGSCIGSGACHLTMDANRTVAVPFYKIVTRKLTVVKPRLGTVISGNIGGIRCGPDDHRCEADIDTRKQPVLKFEGAEGDFGLFESGCTAIVKKTHSKYGLYEECLLNMSQSRKVKTKPSPEQEKRLVGRAMGWAFGRTDYPGLTEFATREDGVPFQYALAAFRSGKGGHTAIEMTKWIQDNWDALLKDTGIGQFMLDYDAQVVRQALHKTFNPDIEAYKPKPWFKADEAYRYIIQDAGQKPFIRAMRDWQYYHRQGVSEFEAYLRNQKQSYFRNEGIEPFFKEPPAPTTPPWVGPTVTQIQADGDQIGRPVHITGSGFTGVTRVLINTQPVEFKFVDDNQIDLPGVRWGISPEFGFLSLLTFYKSGNSFTSNIQASQIHPTIKNADGKVEACFGSIGPGCKGTKGKDFTGTEATNFGKRIGCLAEENGMRVCYTSAGSLRHDNCCVWNPGGKWCGGAGTDGKPAEEWNHNGKCADEWHEAFWDSALERTWTETHKMGVAPDLSPYPSPNKRYSNFEAKGSLRICAPAGTKMRESKDAPFCCSGRLNYWNDCT